MANGSGGSWGQGGETGSSLLDRIVSGAGAIFGGVGSSEAAPAASVGGAAIPEQIVCEFVPGVAMQCPPDYNMADPILQAMTEGTLAGSLVRLTSGYKPGSGKFSRGRSSAQISGDLEIGWAHAATKGKGWMGRDVLRKIAAEHPELAAAAWGPSFGRELATTAFSDEVIDLFLDRSSLPADPRAMTLLQGWNVISKTVPGQRVYAREWWRSKVDPQLANMRRLGWKNRRTLAALVRMRNSGKSGWILENASKGEAAAVEEGLDRYAAHKSHYANDVERIRTWPEFQGVLSVSPKFTDLRYQGPSMVGGQFVNVPGTAGGGVLGGDATDASGGGATVPPGGVTTNGTIKERGRGALYVAGALALVVVTGGGWVIWKITRG